MMSRSNKKTRFGDYFARRLIHTGDKSLVLEAAKASGQRTVAIKLYTPGYDRLARKLEKKYDMPSEAEVGRMLNPGGEKYKKSHLVATLDSGQEYGRRRGNRYVVQEYVRGATLKRLIACHDNRIRQNAKSWTVQLCKALKEIHSAGLVHRDMCSDNVFVDSEDRIKLIDLGFVAPEGVAFEERGGTPSYMAPEQVEGKPLFRAADIYSLGMVIFEMLCGYLPYQSNSLKNNSESMDRRSRKIIMQRHLNDPEPKLPGHCLESHPLLSEITNRCLRKKPEDRYGSVDEMLRLLI